MFSTECYKKHKRYNIHFLINYRNLASQEYFKYMTRVEECERDEVKMVSPTAVR